VPIAQRIYIDESGISQFCYREHARALRGIRVHGFISGRRFTRINVVAGYCDGNIIGEYCYTGSTTSEKFETWFCSFLLPEAHYGDVIIMDNARFHNKKRLREYANVYKVTIIFLPPYSPDLNSIEHIWANMKRFLRNRVNTFQYIQSAIYWFFAVGYS
jgi:transposase